MFKAFFPALAILAIASVAFCATPKKSTKRHHRPTTSASHPASAKAVSSKTASAKTGKGKTSKVAARGKGKTARRPSRSYQQAPSPERYKEIQQALASKGYFQGETTGEWGPDSTEALKRFQADQSLNPDGKISSLSLIALGLGPKRLTAKSDSATPPGTAAPPPASAPAMIIGVAKEIKDHETRVGLVPSGVTALRESGHRVLVETQAGVGSSIPDSEYMEAGGEILATAAEVWSNADLVIKVKEPQPSEYVHFRPGLILFTYLHLAPLPELTGKLLAAKVSSVGYETIRERDGSLPLLTPMSEVAGRMAVQVGAVYLERPNGGRGILLGGVPGVAPANVVILGGGIVGHNSAKMAVGLGAHVTIIDRNLERLRDLDDIYSSQVVTLASNVFTIRDAVRNADLVVGAVLIPGASAPKLVRREMLKSMKPGAVMVDVAIDQGGCFETSHATTHTDPIYFVDGVLHYCVSNMPAAVPHTSTYALTNATFPYLAELCAKGLERACKDNPAIREGVNTYAGKITHPGVAESQGLAPSDLMALL